MPLTATHVVITLLVVEALRRIFLSFYAFIIWSSHSHGNRWLLLSAVMAGFAAGTKMTGIFSIAAIGFLILYSELILAKSRLKNIVVSLGLFSVVSVITAFPFYLKNIIFTGNPFFPLLTNIFGGKFFNPAVLDVWISSGTGISIASLLLVPWNLTMHSLKFEEVLGVGPLFLAFIPLLFFC